MNLPSKIKRNTLVLTLSIFLLSLVGIYMLLEQQLKKSVELEFQRVAAGTKSLFLANIQKSEADLSFKLSNIVAAEGLAEAMARGDYEALKRIVEPYYKKLRDVQKDADILTFRSSENITLLRAHQPDYFGDELNKKRTLIVDTNMLRRPLSGFEVGNLDITYRLTKPIFYKDVYVGNVELGINPKAFLEELGTVFKIDVGVALDKAQLEVLLDKKAVVQIDDKLQLVRGNTTLKNYFLQRQTNQKISYKVDMSIALPNHLLQTMGYLVVGFDISNIIKKDAEFLQRFFFIIALAMLVLVVLMHQSFTKILNHYSEQIYIDHLTGLLNRYALNDALFSKHGKVLIVSNIKEFSLINELYSVDVGNEVLIQIAALFSDFAKERGFNTYRISADEFVLLKEEAFFDEEVCFKTLKELHTRVNGLKIALKEVDEIIGVEIYSGVAFDNEHSLEYAQMALKKARNESLPFMIYSQKVDTKEHSQTVVKVKRSIKHALEHKNVIPFFQPITDHNGKVVKYEALMRIVAFDSGKKRIMYPNEFLSIAMNSELYIKMTKEILSRSLEFFQNREERISLNFLPNDFFNPSVIKTLMEGIEKLESPSRVVVEITEQEGVENFEKLLKVVKKLRAMGVLIAIDDFGSGYANYAHILEIKPDYLKIDGSLICNILSNEDSKILVKSIISFARELHIITVAEYVENEEIFELLKEYGVDEFQGYYFGKPTDLIGAQEQA